MAQLSRFGVSQIGPARMRLSFRAVNRPGQPDYDAGMQRHHILPLQLLTRRALASMLASVSTVRIGFDDFRRNGLLLPANDRAALRIGLPLHRGPHREYNELVIERVGAIEAQWAAQRGRSPEVALADALDGLTRLQAQLRRELLDQHRRMRLNRRDPLGADTDFAELDAMAALLWPATEPPAA